MCVFLRSIEPAGFVLHVMMTVVVSELADVISSFSYLDELVVFINI